MNAIIVSESSIVAGALERCIQAEFRSIRKVCSLKQVRVVENVSPALVIVDLPHCENGLDGLYSLEGAILERCLILARKGDKLHGLVPFVGRVGAIVLDTSSLEDVAMAATMVKNGFHILPEEMKTLFARSPSPARAPLSAVAGLTEREGTVLALITQGHSNKLIARKLHINDSTVRVHVRAVLRKLGVHNRTQAALTVLERRGNERAPAASDQFHASSTGRDVTKPTH